jgi:succinate dehydrogenase / fumarate reductase membrane anchor subunit
MDSVSMQQPKTVKVRRTWDSQAWTLMRYSGFLLIFLAFGHVILQDVIVGVHKINLDYVAARWANVGWRIYDAGLLAFAFAHGMNGVRQVLSDYIHNDRVMRGISIALLVFWFVITAIGTITLIGGVRPIK